MMISRSLTSQEQYVFMGNGIKVQVVSLGIIRLHLNKKNKKKKLFCCKMWRSYPLLEEI